MCDQDCHSVPHELVCVIYSTDITINVQRSAQMTGLNINLVKM